MIAKIIEFSARNKFAVFLMMALAIIWGYWALKNTPLDALPDLSDTQVIIYTEWTGRSPDLVEDQITYPITSTLLAAPKVQAVRGFSFLGSSFIYVIFEEGTDIYWARSRILEYLQAVKNKIPADVNPVLGPDATSLGWGFSYAVVDETGGHDLSELRTIQDYNIKLAMESVPGVSQVASLGGFVKAVPDHHRSQPPSCLQHSHYEGHGGRQKEQPGCGRARPGIFRRGIHDPGAGIHQGASRPGEYRRGREPRRNANLFKGCGPYPTGTGNPERACGIGRPG